MNKTYLIKLSIFIIIIIILIIHIEDKLNKMH